MSRVKFKLTMKLLSLHSETTIYYALSLIGILTVFDYFDYILFIELNNKLPRILGYKNTIWDRKEMG